MEYSSLPPISDQEEEEGLTFLQRYHIDPARFEQQGRSFSFMVRKHMCPESVAKVGQQVEVRVPVEDPRTKRVKFETRRARYGDDPVAVIEECCSKTAQYRNPELPLKEVLNRLLLADGNRPKTVLELYEEVVEWIGRGGGRVITPAVVQRLLGQDDIYGFAAIPQENP